MGLTRKLILEMRNRMENREIYDQEIFKKFFEYLPADANKIFIYASSGSEVNTLPIIERLLAEGKIVYCPKVIQEKEIEFMQIRELSDLGDGLYQIPEPVIPGEEEMDPIALVRDYAVYPEENDIIAIPGLVFDENGGRMGYGSKMYDRYLKKHVGKRVGLSYERQVRSSDIPLSENDIHMDALITEEKIREWNWEE